MRLLALEVKIAADQIIREYLASIQEVAVLVERPKGFARAPAHGRQPLDLLVRHLIEVPFHRVAGIELALDTVQTGHEHGGKRQIWVSRGIGKAHFDALALWRVGCGMRHDAERLRAE